MPILPKRKNGEITPFRNAEYISAFHFIPKSILDKRREEINSIPRNPRKLLQDRRAIEVIESDLFKLVIIDAYAFMVWPFIRLGAKREIYSGYEPSWRYAENTDGMEWDIPDDSVNVESTVLEPIAVSKFLDTLSETDRKILTMRMDDVTFEKIAEELGFKTHSAIHKRIRKIGLAYKKFSGEDLGFSNKKII